MNGTPKWKVVTAGAALAGLTVGGIAIAGDDSPQPVDQIKLKNTTQERADDDTKRSLKKVNNKNRKAKKNNRNRNRATVRGDRADSPDSPASVASAPSPQSPSPQYQGGTDSVNSPASADSAGSS